MNSPTEGNPPPVPVSPESFRYAAFISYRHVEPDRKWARWLHAALENYRVPGRLRCEKGLPERLGRVFRDEEELSASSDLSREIESALKESKYLIVVCSPRTPASQWVNREVERFREMGRHDQILALLIEGDPAESFPRALYEIRPRAAGPGAIDGAAETAEPLAADVRKGSHHGHGHGSHTRTIARLRLLAVMLGVRFDDLRQRERRRRTQRMALAAAAAVILIGLIGAAAAIQWRAHGMQRLSELAGQLDNLSERDDWTPQRIDSAAALVSQITSADPGLGATADQRLRTRIAAAIRGRIQRPTLVEADFASIEPLINRFRAIDPKGADEVHSMLEGRRQDWVPTFALRPPFDDAHNVLVRGAFGSSPGGVVFTGSGDGLLLETSVPCGIDAEAQARVRLTPGKAQAAGLAFVEIGTLEKSRYVMWASEKAVGIDRDGIALVRRNFAAPLDLESPIQILARRDGERLSLQVNAEPPLEFEDIFPLTGSLAFALYGSEQCQILEATGRRKSTARTPSRLEKGDLLSSQDKWAEAAAEYESQAAVETGQDRNAARYKEALCLVHLGRPGDAAGLLETTVADVDPKWSALAAARLAIVRLEMGKTREATEALNLMVSGFTGSERLITALPEADRKRLSEYERAPLGSMFFLTAPEDAIQRLRLAVRTDDLLDPGSAAVHWDRFALIRAYQQSGQLASAEAAGADLFSVPLSRQIFPDVGCEALCWVMRSTGRPADALSMLDRHLAEWKQSGQPSADQMLVERARINVNLGHLEEADRDLDRFFQSPKGRADPYPYAFRGSAALLRGLLRERRGDHAGALEAWNLGLLLADGSGGGDHANPENRLAGGGALGSSDSCAVAAMIGGLTGRWTPAEGKLVSDRLVAQFLAREKGTSDSATGTGAAPLPSLVTGASIDPEICYQVWAIPRGRDQAWHHAIRDGSLWEWQRSALAMPGEGFFIHGAINGTPSPQQEEVFWRATCDLLDALAARKIGSIQVMLGLAGWKRGVTGVLGADGFIARLPEEQRDRCNYIMALRYIRLGQPDDARATLKRVIQSVKPEDPLAKLAQSELAAMKP